MSSGSIDLGPNIGAVEPTGPAGGDLSGSYPNPSVATVGGSAAAAVHTGELASNAATNSNTASTIVKRDASGNFSAGTITASLTGHASLDLAAGNNLSDVSSAATSRVNLNIDKRTTVNNADYVILATDRVVAQTGTLSALRTFTLPAANSVNSGQEFLIFDESGTVTSTNMITITRAGADTFEGGITSTSISSPFGFQRLYSDGTSKWYISARNPNLQTFTGSGTWTKPAGVMFVRVVAIGGGGGGGSGRSAGAGTTRGGGGGGSGGAYVDRILLARDCGATEAVTIGGGGSGAGGVTNTSGNAGNAGGDSLFGTDGTVECVVAKGGPGGYGGLNVGSGNPTPVYLGGGQGGSYTNATIPGFIAPIGIDGMAGGTGGGGGGGPLNTADGAGSGGAGGLSAALGSTSGTKASGGAGGGSNQGSLGASVTANLPLGGGGGGGGGANAAGIGGAGNNGGTYGGGGGGGGAAISTSASGAGGNGGAGILVVWSW